MKKISVLLCIFLSSFVPLFSQTQAEIDKIIKDAQDQIEKLKKDTATKDLFKDIPNLDSMMKKAKGDIPADPKTKVSDTAAFSLPSRNNKLLSSLPIRTFNRNELISYLHNLYSKLTEYLRSTYKTDINDFALTAIKQSGTPIGLWMKGKVNESVLVTLKAAELQPDNNLKLNNTGGILTSCGLGYYAIPILEYVLEKQPDNNMILNNLGQAYLDLGDDKKAEQYLLKCIKSYKYYPDANLALAYIYNSRGNKSVALNYVENSLRGAWSSKANTLLKKLKPDANLMDYVKHRYKQPEYFNFHEYKMLPQCRKVEDIHILEPQYVAYNSMLQQLKDKYHKLYGNSLQLWTESMPKKLNEASKTKRTPYRPFGTFGGVVLAALRTENKEKFKQLYTYRQNYKKQRQELNDKYKIEYKKLSENGNESTEERCRKINALSNAYLPLYADQTEALQQKLLPYYKNYLNDESYWCYIASINEDEFHVEFYKLFIEFVGLLLEVNTTRFMETRSVGGFNNSGGDFYPCEYDTPNSIKGKELVVVDPECGLMPKIELDLGAFKLEVSCETYKLEAGEGLVGKIEYTRSSGDITLALGVGASVPKVFFKSPGIEAGLEADVKSQVYITFNNLGTPVDLGILWEAELKGVIGMGSVKETIGLEEGLTVGFGNGVQMKENSQLKQAIDKTFPVQPDDNQQNKNVPLYKKII